ELDCFLYGVEHYPGELSRSIIQSVVREMLITWQDAVASCCVLDVIGVARRFARAAKYEVSEEDVAFLILYLLPHPAQLTEPQQGTLATFIDQVETAYGGAVERMERRWQVLKPLPGQRTG